MSEEDIITIAAQHITRGDYMTAMSIFEEHISSFPTTLLDIMAGQKQQCLRYKKMEILMKKGMIE